MFLGSIQQRCKQSLQESGRLLVVNNPLPEHVGLCLGRQFNFLDFHGIYMDQEGNNINDQAVTLEVMKPSTIQLESAIKEASSLSVSSVSTR